MENKQLLSEKIRNCAGEITTSQTGKEARETLSEAFILIADAISEEEIPIRKLMKRCYMRGGFIGAVAAQILIAILIILSRLL